MVINDDGGTGALDDGIAAQQALALAAAAVVATAPPDSLSPTAVVEQYGDIHEYGLSLGVDLDAEGEEDLAWAVQEAFNAPLPSSWTEYMDESGRAYYVKEGSTQSTWEHPMDSVYRELLEIVREARSQQPSLSEGQRTDLVREHLRKAHKRLKAELAGWSGPYNSDQGEYYYHETLKISTWESPVTECENELATRHSVLARYLIPEQATSGSASPSSGHVTFESSYGNNSSSMLQALRLQLGNLHRDPVLGEIPEPSTCRSYHTARSGTSSRSGRSKKLGEGKERRKERKSRREATSDGEAGRSQLEDLPEG